MTMTSKDYELITACLDSARLAAERMPERPPADHIRELIHDLAHSLEVENPGFKYSTFIAACGL